MSPWTVICTVTFLSALAGFVEGAPPAAQLSHHTLRTPTHAESLMRLRGGHKEGCGCGEAGESSESWIHDAVDPSHLCSFNTEKDRGVEAAFRPYCERDDPSKWLESSDDDQVLMCFTFKSLVNLKSIHLRASGESAPKRVKLFANQAVDDFDKAEDLQADDQWDHPSNVEAIQEHRLPEGDKFMQIRQLTIFIENSNGDDKTRIEWLGFMGENTNIKVGGIVESEYELRPKGGLQTPGLFAGPGHAGF
mmetsp:Transcript_41167/g.64320  ORF Transcript_41167/g.64320 Transcript_41167/m.64320 type:complete len:249 (+) Transcript_41167:108-854(+)